MTNRKDEVKKDMNKDSSMLCQHSFGEEGRGGKREVLGGGGVVLFLLCFVFVFLFFCFFVCWW